MSTRACAGVAGAAALAPARGACAAHRRARPRRTAGDARIVFPTSRQQGALVIGKVPRRQHRHATRGRALRVSRRTARSCSASAATRPGPVRRARSTGADGAARIDQHRGDAARLADRAHRRRAAGDRQSAAGDRRADRARAGAGRRRARARRRPRRLRPGLRLAGAGPHQRPLRQPARLQRHAANRAHSGMDIAAPQRHAGAGAGGRRGHVRRARTCTSPAARVLLDHGHGVSSQLPAPVAHRREGRRPRGAGPGHRRGRRDRARDRAAPALGDELVRRAHRSVAGAGTRANAASSATCA